MRTALRIAAAVAALASTAALVPLAATPADIVRGRALYDLHCQGCHAESVHGRVKRVARDFEDVRSWVARWNATLKLGWDAQEVEDVTLHLNATYYRFPCPPSTCKVVSLR